MLANLAEIISGGVILISILQIYNWFSYNHICSLLALYFSAELFGYLTPIPILPEKYYY